METGLDLAALRDFGIALLIGALVGAEREQQRQAAPGPGSRGLRTFIVLAMLGAVSAWLGKTLGTPWIFAAVLVVASASLIVAYFIEAQAFPAEAGGLTTEVAAICVCLLGGMTMVGNRDLAVVLGVVLTAVLAYKQPMHALIGRLGRDDMFAGLRLLIATFIVLPLLPSRPLDPWGALNPYSLWLLVILISSLSLIGYVATRWLGPGRGAALTGLTGGLVSSTAVTLSFARSSTDSGNRGFLLTSGILIAWGVMFVRVIVEVALVYNPLVSELLIPFLSMGAAALAAAAFYYRKAGADETADQPDREVPLKNPFSLTGAAKFALLFAFVLLLVKLAQTRFPSQGLYLVAGLAGLTDVDAITLSMAKYAQGGGDPDVAVRSITIAALSNSIVKCGLVAVLGARMLKRQVIVSTLLIIMAGAVSLLFI